MWFRRHRRPRSAIVLICGCALASLYLFQRNVWRDCTAQNISATERFVARYEPLLPLLPPDEIVGFVLDECHVDAELMYPGARLFLAQYALSPRRLTCSPTSRWVIVDSDRLDVAPEMAASARWQLRADLHNGVRLYQTDVRE